MGAAAIDYAAAHDGIAGVIGLAAGDFMVHPPSDVQRSIARARDLVARGNGDTVELRVQPIRDRIC